MPDVHEEPTGLIFLRDVSAVLNGSSNSNPSPTADSPVLVISKPPHPIVHDVLLILGVDIKLSRSPFFFCAHLSSTTVAEYYSAEGQAV